MAYDLKLYKYWAVKQFFEDSREAEVLKELDHPALPRIVDILEEDDCQYLVMDLLEGKTLEQIKKEGNRISWKNRIRWAIQLCDILQYLHGPMEGIIYQDMKPSNILIHLSGDVRMLDFGIAGRKKENTKSGYGTVGFAAPEQYEGSADEQSDIFGLGAVMKYMENEGKSKSGYYRQWCRIRQKCMEPSRQRRYKNVQTVKKELIYLEKQYQGRRRVYKGSILIALGGLCILGGWVRKRELLMDAGGLLAGGSYRELSDTADYETARDYFLNTQKNSPLKKQYGIIIHALEDSSENTDWVPVKKAMEELEKAEETSWENARENVFLANIYIAYEKELGYTENKGVSKAVSLLKKAKEQTERNKSEILAPVYRMEILRQLGNCYEKLNEREEALICYEELLRENLPDSLQKEVLLSAGGVNRLEKKYEEAAACYESLIKHFPEDAQAYCAYALMEALERNDVGKAKKLLLQMDAAGVESSDFNCEIVRKRIYGLKEEKR